MKIIAGSKFVNWDDYPDAVCGIVWEVQTDFNLPTGGVLGKGTKFTWLIDRLPYLIAGTLHIHESEIWYLDGIGGDMEYSVSVIDAKELHLRPEHYEIKTTITPKETIVSDKGSKSASGSYSEPCDVILSGKCQ